MKKTGTTLFIAIMALAGQAVDFSDGLTWEEGRTRILGLYKKWGFETGAGVDNDKSLLCPFSFQISGHGQYVFYSDACNKYNDGRLWEARRVDGGRFELASYKYATGKSLQLEPSIRFEPWQLFQIEYYDGTKKLAYRDEWHKKFEDMDNVYLISFTWWFVSMTTNAVQHKTVIENGACGLIADRNVKSIRNIIPLRYCGPDADPPAGSTREQARLAESDKTTASWRISGEQMQALATLHRDHVKQQKPSSIVTNVFIVAGDCNGDGVCDAYVSCDAEKADGENCDWSLYISDGGKFARQTQKIAPLTDLVEIVNADPRVRVPKDSFFRFDRIDMPSYVMPITTEDGVPETWDYAKNGGFVKAFRAENNVPTASFDSCEMLNNVNIASLQDMFFMIRTSVVYAERLPCIEIPVEN